MMMHLQNRILQVMSSGHVTGAAPRGTGENTLKVNIIINASMSYDFVILQQSEQVALLCQVRLAFKKPLKVEEEEVEDQEPLLEGPLEDIELCRAAK